MSRDKILQATARKQPCLVLLHHVSHDLTNISHARLKFRREVGLALLSSHEVMYLYNSDCHAASEQTIIIKGQAAIATSQNTSKLERKFAKNIAIIMCKNVHSTMHACS